MTGGSYGAAATGGYWHHKSQVISTFHSRFFCRLYSHQSFSRTPLTGFTARYMAHQIALLYQGLRRAPTPLPIQMLPLRAGCCAAHESMTLTALRTGRPTAAPSECAKWTARRRGRREGGLLGGLLVARGGGVPASTDAPCAAVTAAGAAADAIAFAAVRPPSSRSPSKSASSRRPVSPSPPPPVAG